MCFKLEIPVLKNKQKRKRKKKKRQQLQKQRRCHHCSLYPERGEGSKTGRKVHQQPAEFAAMPQLPLLIQKHKLGIPKLRQRNCSNLSTKASSHPISADEAIFQQSTWRKSTAKMAPAALKAADGVMGLKPKPLLTPSPGFSHQT